MFRVSVLTATYNRAHTLQRVYESLSRQTFRDFEWLIVDDGSTDATPELVKSWKPWFPVRYFQKPNAGKHSAINFGVREATGELLALLDSDDACVPHALETLERHWRAIPDPLRFAAVGCFCCTPEGRVLGNQYSRSPTDALTFRDVLRISQNREGWSMIRTEVMRQFPYPEGEPFVMESLVWNRIFRHYAVRFVNDALRIYFSSQDGLSWKGKQLLIASPKATRAYFRELALSPAPASVRVKAALNFFRFAMVSRLASRGPS
jgi:glycosyltransferase involved in cell wall biosynthesis